MKRIAIAGVVVVGLAVLAWMLLGERILGAAVQRQVQANISGARLADLPDGLHLMICGAGAPLADPTRAGPCMVVMAGQDMYVVDVGSGSVRNFGPMGIPAGRIEALFLTHFHSDHIDGFGELMTSRWAGGARQTPLPVYGPTGVAQVVQGYNLAYAQDFAYRTAHHGESVAPQSGAGARAQPFALPAAGQAVEVLSRNGLTITAFAVEHEPVQPAVGYRFDYKGRSLVISGDTKQSANLEAFSRNVDLLAHEALAPNLLQVLHDAAAAESMEHIRQITVDILDYHTTPVEAAESAQRAGARHLLLYHLVPPVPVRALERLFLKGVAEAYDGEVTLARDGQIFSLPAANQSIRVDSLL